MSRRWLLASVSLILTAAFISYLALNKDDHFIPEGMGEVRGTLLNGDGGALYGYRVRLEDLQGRDARPQEFGASLFGGRTDEAGGFAFWARPGTYWVYARVLSDTKTNRVRVKVKAGQVIDDIDLRLSVVLTPSPGVSHTPARAGQA